jgi:hypothetical protein
VQVGVDQNSAARANCLDPSCGCGDPGQWIRNGIANEHRLLVGPREQARGGCNVVAETDGIALCTVPSVGGDCNPGQPRICFDERSRNQAQLFESTRAGAADHQVGTAHESSQTPLVPSAFEIERDRLLACIQSIEELRRARADAIWTANTFNLDDPRSAGPQQVPA